MLHIFKFLLVISFTNAKLERMFSIMLHVKTDWRNGLNRLNGLNGLNGLNLDSLLCIGEESQSIGEFDPSNTINLWFNDKVGCLTASQHLKNNKRLIRMSMLTLPR